MILDHVNQRKGLVPGTMAAVVRGQSSVAVPPAVPALTPTPTPSSLSAPIPGACVPPAGCIGGRHPLREPEAAGGGPHPNIRHSCATPRAAGLRGLIHTKARVLHLLRPSGLDGAVRTHRTHSPNEPPQSEGAFTSVL